MWVSTPGETELMAVVTLLQTEAVHGMFVEPYCVMLSLKP